MNKTSSLIFVMVLCILTACVSNTPADATSSNEDTIGTIVASTVSAIPTATPLPAVSITTQATSAPTIGAPTAGAPTVSAAPILTLDDFTNKVLLGEDDSYAVYLTNSSGGDAPEGTGELVVYDKNQQLVYQITGSFTPAGTTIVSHDSKGEYVLLSTGTYILRTAILLSLNDKKQAVNDFCIQSGQAGSHFFWNDYVIFNNCDTFGNRPWGAGEAPGITAVNLKTGVITDIAKSDLTHQFEITMITGNDLQYLETYVEKEEDWQAPDKQNSVTQTYNLLSLETNN